MISSNAKALRSSQNETAEAIAKINSIRGHAEGFAENMLHNAANGQAPDLVTTWAAFSGVLTSETIGAADWNATKDHQEIGPGDPLQERLRYHRVLRP